MTEDKSPASITFEVTIDEANLILESLGKQPFQRVYQLIHRLQEQARQQLEDSDEGASGGPEESL